MAAYGWGWDGPLCSAHRFLRRCGNTLCWCRGPATPSGLPRMSACCRAVPTMQKREKTPPAREESEKYGETRPLATHVRACAALWRAYRVADEKHHASPKGRRGTSQPRLMRSRSYPHPMQAYRVYSAEKKPMRPRRSPSPSPPFFPPLLPSTSWSGSPVPRAIHCTTPPPHTAVDGTLPTSRPTLRPTPRRERPNGKMGSDRCKRGKPP